MKHIRLFHDETLELDLEKISRHLNSICEYLTFSKGKTIVVLQDTVINYPRTFSNLSDTFLREVRDDYKAIIITRKQFDNNHFFAFSGNLVILSFFAWEVLTSLPISNGVVFFIADFLALHIDHSFRHNLEDGSPKPECIYDFGMDKEGVDIGMRSSLICPACIQRIRKMVLSTEKTKMFDDLKRILNDLGNASKWDTDILEFWDTRGFERQHQQEDLTSAVRNQVFISYSHLDAEWLQRLKTHLKPFERNYQIHVWDDTKIKTGRDWKQEITEALARTKVAVLLISANFLASDFIASDELPALFTSANESGTIIMPIILKPCTISRFPNLSKFQSVNSPSKTLVEMNEGEQDRVLLQLTEDILTELA